MIGKPEWFTRRKYFGWGLYPKTWQGWVYVAVIMAIIAIIQYIPGLNNITKLVSTLAIAALVCIDVIHMMIKMKRDERDKIHEAIAERNALWAVLVVLCIGIGFQAAQSAVKGQFVMDPIVIAALVVGLLAKAITNMYLDRYD